METDDSDLATIYLMTEAERGDSLSFDMKIDIDKYTTLTVSKEEILEAPIGKIWEFLSNEGMSDKHYTYTKVFEDDDGVLLWAYETYRGNYSGYIWVDKYIEDDGD